MARAGRSRHRAARAQACVDVLGSADDVDVPVGGPEILTREDIVRLAFAAVGRRPRILHLPPRALLAGAAVLGRSARTLYLGTG